MTMKRLTRLSCLTLILMLTSACLSIGPRVKTEVVIVRLGKPLQVLENVTVKCRRVGDGSVGNQDIGGWYCMPKDHFERLIDRASRAP